MIKPRMRQAIDDTGRKGWVCFCQDIGVFGLHAAEAYSNWKAWTKRRIALRSLS